MIAPAAHVQLNVENTSENVLLVRDVLTGVAAAVGLDALEADDLTTAVIKTCNNVVHHAYEGGPGPLAVEVYLLAGLIDVVVRDRGIGIRPHIGERTLPHTGIGMPIVHALTEYVGFSKLAHGGTEVRMRFAMPDIVAPALPQAERSLAGGAAAAGRPTAIELVLASNALASQILPRTLSLLSVRSGFSATGGAEAVLLADAIADAAAGRLDVALDPSPGALQLHARPLRPGATALLLAAAAERRALRIEQMQADAGATGAGELLALRLAERA